MIAILKFDLKKLHFQKKIISIAQKRHNFARDIYINPFERIVNPFKRIGNSFERISGRKIIFL